MPEKILEIKGLSVSFDGQDAIKGVNMDVTKGQFIGIIGPNGGGKTTLLKVILGLVKPDSGKVKKPPGMRIGYVPQYSNFDKDFPIKLWDMVISARIGLKKPWSRFTQEDDKKADEVLKTLGISNLKENQIGELSGGQQQRALIARALAIEPDLLILDEPTASVDTASGKKIYDTLNELNKKGITIILVSHDVGVISKYVKTIACMNVWLFSHDSNELTDEMLSKAYQCPVDLIAHGHPHRVLEKHKEAE